MSVVISGLSVRTSSVPMAPHFVQPSAANSPGDFLSALHAVQNDAVTSGASLQAAQSDTKGSVVNQSAGAASADRGPHQALAGSDASAAATQSGTAALATQVWTTLLPNGIVGGLDTAASSVGGSNNPGPRGVSIDTAAPAERPAALKTTHGASGATPAMQGPSRPPAPIGRLCVPR